MRVESSAESRLLDAAAAAAARSGNAHVDAGHLLLALIDEYAETLGPHLVQHGVDRSSVQQALVNGSEPHLAPHWGMPRDGVQPIALSPAAASLLRRLRLHGFGQVGGESTWAPAASAAAAHYVGLPRNPAGADTPTARVAQAITPSRQYGVDLISLAEEGRLDQVTGRDHEIRRVAHVLCRRKKRNPVLVGAPGVGKTAIVEGLAQRIAREEAHPFLTGVRIVGLDMGTLLAGTRYRGEFEERVNAVLAEVRKAGRQVILFIDEVDLVVSAGAAQGGLDAASMLLPELARGEVAVIGATTPQRFDEAFRPDTPIARRFEVVQVVEPTRAQAVAMLAGVKRQYEEFHGVTISPGALDEAVTASRRIVPHRHLPDRALDLLDSACVAVSSEPGTSARSGQIVTAARVRQVVGERAAARNPRVRLARTTAVLHNAWLAVRRW